MHGEDRGGQISIRYYCNKLAVGDDLDRGTKLCTEYSVHNYVQA